MYLGQVNLVLMALILWDLTQPDTDKTRWWKGFGTGVAAGIKLTPLIFIPYLLVARKFRQAAMACAGFAFTVLLGFAILPERLHQVVVRRAVGAERPDRLRRLGRQPVARGPHHQADRQRAQRPTRLAGGGGAVRPARAWRPPGCSTARGTACWRC